MKRPMIQNDSAGYKPRLLDLYCKAGGASMGYSRAGFEVVGVDIEPQPRYPLPFILGDAIDLMTRMIAGEKFLASDGNWYGMNDFDAFAASPPCQAYSRARSVHKKFHPDLIPATRIGLKNTGKPFVIENVEGAPLKISLLLCGTMFGLRTRRHRIFESNVDIGFPQYSCSCAGGAKRGDLLNLHNSVQRATYMRKQGYEHVSVALRESIGVEWMDMDSAQEAIPPAYTEFIGRKLMDFINTNSSALIKPKSDNL